MDVGIQKQRHVVAEDTRPQPGLDPEINGDHLLGPSLLGPSGTFVFLLGLCDIFLGTLLGGTPTSSTGLAALAPLTFRPAAGR